MLLIMATLAAVYVGIALLAFVGQRSLIYPAPADRSVPAVEGATLLQIVSVTGRTVYALYAPAPPGAPTVVHFHGNGEGLVHQGWLIRELRARGLGVFAVEYPGYGPQWRDTPSESALYDAAEAALVHLKERLGVPREQLVLQGQSLGTGVAFEMAARGHGARLVVLSPFTSLPDVARRVFPFLPTGWLLLDRYDNLGKAPRLQLPVLVIHGERDTLIPSARGRRLVERLPDARSLFVPGANHNDLFYRAGDSVLERIAEFARAGR